MEDDILHSDSDAGNVDFTRQLITFNFWENQRVWDLAIEPLTDDQFTQEVSSLKGSIRRECLEIINTEWVCLERIQGFAIGEIGSIESLADRKEIAAGWTLVRQAWTEFADALNEDQFFSQCEFELDGVRHKIDVWKVIFHVLYHGTSRRSGILRLVAEVHQPVDFDLSLLQHLTGLLRE